MDLKDTLRQLSERVLKLKDQILYIFQLPDNLFAFGDRLSAVIAGYDNAGVNA